MDVFDWIEQIAQDQRRENDRIELEAGMIQQIVHDEPVDVMDAEMAEVMRISLLSVIDETTSGNCLFVAVSQAFTNGETDHSILRAEAVTEAVDRYMYNGFIRGLDDSERVRDFINRHYESLDDYISIMTRLTTWGSEFEFEMLAKVYGVTGVIMQNGAEKYRTAAYGRKVCTIQYAAQHYYVS